MKAVIFAVVVSALVAAASAQIITSVPGAMNPLCVKKLKNDKDRYKCYSKTMRRLYQAVHDVTLSDLVKSANVFIPWMEPTIMGRTTAGAFTGVALNAEYLAVAFPAMEIFGDSAEDPIMDYFTSMGNVAAFSASYLRTGHTGHGNYTLWGFAKFHPETNRMTHYDVDFRRYLELLYSLGTLRPDAQAMAAFQTYLAGYICNVTMRTCVGSLQQYQSQGDCVAFLQVRPFIKPSGAVAADCLLCRVVHTILLPFNVNLHCPHVGPTGGGACTDVPYANYYQFFPPYAFVAKKQLMR